MTDAEDIEFEELEVDEQEATTELELNNLEYIDPKNFTDENIPQEYIDECKMLGMPRLPNISYSRWHSPIGDKLAYEYMLSMAVAGMPATKIAVELNYHPDQVRRVLAKPEIKEAIEIKKQEVFGKDYKNYLSSRMQKSLAVLDNILDSDKVKDNVRLAAAQMVIEHTVGKPQQTVEHKGNLLAEVIATADKQLHAKEVIESKPSPVDNLIKELIPTDMIVGKRS